MFSKPLGYSRYKLRQEGGRRNRFPRNLTRINFEFENLGKFEILFETAFGYNHETIRGFRELCTISDVCVK
jgi:hypothetical protein